MPSVWTCRLVRLIRYVTTFVATHGAVWPPYNHPYLRLEPQGFGNFLETVFAKCQPHHRPPFFNQFSVGYVVHQEWLTKTITDAATTTTMTTTSITLQPPLRLVLRLLPPHPQPQHNSDDGDNGNDNHNNNQNNDGNDTYNDQNPNDEQPTSTNNRIMAHNMNQ